MTLRDVVLPYEKERISNFLHKQGLKYEQNIDTSIYLEQEDCVIGTVSASGCVIKCLAVDDRYRDDSIAVKLVNAILEKLRQKDIKSYQVFTKPAYKSVFESMNFRSLLQTDKVVMLEGGVGTINEAIDRIKIQLKFNLGIDLSNKQLFHRLDLACVVVNANPFTNGHLQLIQRTREKHTFVIVFVVEEEGSYFSFKERYALSYLSLKQYPNVMVVPSTHYIVSRATFPGYFLADAQEVNKQYAQCDAMLFAEYFMPQLAIGKRYVGQETTDYMMTYNNTLKDVLGNKLEILPRFQQNGAIISAKTVREYISQGNFEQATKLVPEASQAVFRAILQSK